MMRNRELRTVLIKGGGGGGKGEDDQQYGNSHLRKKKG